MTNVSSTTIVVIVVAVVLGVVLIMRRRLGRFGADAGWPNSANDARRETDRHVRIGKDDDP